MKTPESDAHSNDTPRALLYLRVSTAEQAKRGGEAEGYSLPAQREACARKAESLGAIIVDEYVEPGESGRTDKRPALQAMLKRIKEQRDVDMVIVHKINRWARNRYDDALLGLTLRKAGVQFVSAAENIDGTPAGMLLHGILASYAEFESANLALEVIKGSTQKAKAGGTPRLAPLGYLNTGTIIDGREVRTVILDPERAELVRCAFEAYATGDYSLVRLLDELTEKGLTTKPNRRCPPHPLHLSKLHLLLQNPYYKGVVRYRGVEYQGKHEPLVSADTFEQVQVILQSHRNGEKQRTHNHYLRGTLFCGFCDARLCFTNAKGKSGGHYPYYFCLSRHKNGGCHQPYMPVAEIEKEITRYYQGIQLDPSEAEELRELIRSSAERIAKANSKEIARQQRRLNRLNNERLKLLQLQYGDAVPLDLFKAEQERIGREMADAQRIIQERQAEYVSIEQNLGKALRIASDCGRLYATAPPMVKRLFNQAIFEKLLVEGGRVVKAELAEPFAKLVEAAEFRRLARQITDSDIAPGQFYRRESPPLVSVSGGLNNDLLVGDRGFEPR